MATHRWISPGSGGRGLGIATAAFKSGRLTAVRITGKQGRLIFS